MSRARKGICCCAVELAGGECRFSVQLETPSITDKEGAFIRIVCKDEAGADAVRDAILKHSVGFAGDILEAQNA